MANPKSLDFIEGGETYRAVQIFAEGSDGNPALIYVTGTGINTSEQTLQSGEGTTRNVTVVERRLTHANMNATASLAVSSVPSLLGSITINKPIATSIVTVYDGISAAGDVVAVIDASNFGTLNYDVWCATGVFVVMSVANSDITIGYK